MLWVSVTAKDFLDRNRCYIDKVELNSSILLDCTLIKMYFCSTCLFCVMFVRACNWKIQEPTSVSTRLNVPYVLMAVIISPPQEGSWANPEPKCIFLNFPLLINGNTIAFQLFVFLKTEEFNLHSFSLQWDVIVECQYISEGAFSRRCCLYTGAAGPRLFTIHQIDASTNNLPKAHTW